MPSNDYNTLSSAITALKERGYEKDIFGLIRETNDPDQFTIVEIHHFEGIVNPEDNSILYVVECRNGEKGIVTDLNGINNETDKSRLLSQIKVVADKPGNTL